MSDYRTLEGQRRLYREYVGLEPDEPIGSTPWSQPQKWLGFFFGALLVVIIAGELIGS